MAKIDLIRQEMMAALKARDMKRKEVLSLLLSALKSKQIDKRAELTEEEENAVIFKQIKEAQETIDTSPADRLDVIEEGKFKIGVYTEFAPQRMGEDEIRVIVKNVLAELGLDKPSPQDKGKIMKTLMPLVKGKADGTLINKIVEELTRQA